MLYIEPQKVYGVWQVDLRKPCPFGMGLGQGYKKIKIFKK
jgi:hypothetical protein